MKNKGFFFLTESKTARTTKFIDLLIIQQMWFISKRKMIQNVTVTVLKIFRVVVNPNE